MFKHTNPSVSRAAGRTAAETGHTSMKDPSGTEPAKDPSETDWNETLLTVQSKLEMGHPNDPFEQEADAVADKVMRSETTVQRKCTTCAEEEEVQMKPLVQMKTSSRERGKNTPSWVEQQIHNSRGNGQSLPDQTRSFMESSIGAGFHNVKVHTDNTSVQMNRELGAKAFTVGNDIYFNSGQYAPESSEGKRLLAHELTHTVQQTGADSQVIQRTGPDDEIPAPSPPPDVEVEGPHLVIGHVPRGARERIRGQLIEDVQSWARNRGRRQSDLTEYFGDWNSGMEALNEQKDQMVEAYRTARGIFSERVSAAGETMARRQAFAKFVTGMLPGLGSVTGSMRAATIGLGWAVQSFFNHSLSQVSAQATDPLTGVLNDLITGPEVPEVSAESVDHFALRLTNSLLFIQTQLTGISQFGAIMGRDDLRISSEDIARQIQGRNPSEEVIEAANRIQQMEQLWPRFVRRIGQFNSVLGRSRFRLQETSLHWTPLNLEKMLWIVYIASLPRDETGVIDVDDIENRLRELRIIGHDGGSSYLAIDFGADTNTLGLGRDTFVARQHALGWERAVLASLENFDAALSREVLSLRSSIVL